tara:strand:+ start:33 stop:1505 length:1473 start_codon:yes stop_codon:yes gene_type:complete
MATFSRGFLSSLGRPQMAEGLFNLGAAIGGVPGQIRERKKKEQELQAFNQMAQASEQGTAAALEGNVEGLQNQINQLIKMRDAATDINKKQNIQKAITNLQGQISGAKKISVGNKARELVNIEQQLASLPSGATAQRLALQKRQEVLQNDPEAMRQYQQYQLDTFRYEQAEKEVQAEQWLNSNRALMLEAIEAGDTDKLTSIIEGAGDYVGAAQKFANAALQSAENMAKFEENSMEQKIGPSVVYYTEQVNNLPEEIGKNLRSTLDAYTKVSEEGWDGKQWNTAARIRAKRLEKDLQSQLRAINSQIATSAYFEGRREEARIKQQIKEIEIKLDTPMGSRYIKDGRIMAQTLLGKDEVTEAEIYKYAQQLYDLDQQQLRQQLAALTGEEPVEEEDFSVMVGNNLTTSSMVREAISRKGEKSVVKQLRDNGVSEEDIESLIGKKPDKAEELGILDQRIEKQKRRFSDELGTRDERMAALGTREQRMAALPR